MGIPAPTELLLILGIVIMIFGAKRIPEIMGGVAQGIKSFKKNLDDDNKPAQQLEPSHEAQPSGPAAGKSQHS